MMNMYINPIPIFGTVSGQKLKKRRLKKRHTKTGNHEKVSCFSDGKNVSNSFIYGNLFIFK